MDQPERATYRHGDLKAEAVRIGIELLEKSGADAVSMRKIAGQAGVTHRALYRHFGDRDALLRSIAAAGFDQMADRLAGITDRVGFLKAYVRFAIDKPNLYALMMSRTNAEFNSNDELGKSVSAVIALSKHALAPGNSGKKGDLAVIRIWMLLHGGITLNQNGVLAPRSADELVEMLVDFAER